MVLLNRALTLLLRLLHLNRRLLPGRSFGLSPVVLLGLTRAQLAVLQLNLAAGSRHLRAEYFKHFVLFLASKLQFFAIIALLLFFCEC